MNASLPPVLVVDDEKNMRLSLKALLADEGYEVRTAESAEEGLALLGQEEFFMVITDARLGAGMSGYELLGRLHARWPDLPVLMITAYATPKLAVEAIKAGAFDYVAKPFAPEEMLHALRKIGGLHDVLQENKRLRDELHRRYDFSHIIANSPQMLHVLALAGRVAPRDTSVMITGESGTGKELLARAIHVNSTRAHRPMVRINCAAIPETLLESELFGHERGAFTGALKQKAGRVEEADRGSIFLDEIADMSRPLQAKLLRFLEDGTFTRVGGTQELRVDVRLIAATNRDIIDAIRQNEFREDLFHRLNVVQFRLPPLRDRGQDVLLLADHFLKHFGQTMRKSAKRISRAAQQKLASHHWPGNVRELRNVIERALILERTDEIQPGSLPDFELETGLRKGAAAPRAAVGESLDEMMSNFERELINGVLEQNHYSLTRSAEHLKLSRHALRYRMQRLNISLEGESDDEAAARGPKEEAP